MEILRKSSIHRQMMTLFIGIMVFVLGSLYFINLFCLEPYYISIKQTEFVSFYELLENASIRQQFENEGESALIYQTAERANMSFFVMDESGMLATNVRDDDILNRQLFGYLVEKQEPKRKILESEEKYQITEIKERYTGITYIEMWGTLENQQYFLVRSPLESIRESAGISNHFLLIVGCVMIVFCLILIWFFSKKFTEPIMELILLSSRMANLDFDAKYEGNGAQEIDQLGENFNRMSENLERTISELKSANNILQRDLEKRDKMEQMRNEFLGNVSHELKTPLALIQGYAEGLKDGVSDDPESREYYCEVILDEAEKMNQMVRNLLTLNQLEFGNQVLEFERFNLVEMISGILMNMELMAKQEQIELRFQNIKPVYVWADQYQVEHVIRNYLSNAFHHVAGEKIIEIKIELHDHVARTSVFNTGKPIPEADINHIWDKFYKVDKAHTRAYGGNGIGLSIVKAIMNSLEQQYGVNNYDNGVEFWFELDLK